MTVERYGRSACEAALARMSPESQRRLGQSLSELTDALGETSSHAWTLGWSDGDAR